jgi:site-specific DNA-methyltransferase (adenine-specific)
MSQLALFNDQSLSQPVFVSGIDPHNCQVSEHNPRRTRNQDDIDALAEQMATIGFKPDRALYAYTASDGMYEVFAGGNRLFAAQKLNTPICLWLCDDWDEQTISRMAIEDNNSDGLYTAPPLTDIWAYYHRLNKEKGWTQQEIADTLGVVRATVSRRVKWHDTMPDDIKEAVWGGCLTEHHLQQISGDCGAPHKFPNWQAWRLGVLRRAIEKGWSSRQLAAQWDHYKQAAARANELVATIPDGNRDEYINNDGGKIERVETDWQQAFIDILTVKEAKSVAAVDHAFTLLRNRQSQSKERKRQLEAALSEEERRQADEQRIVETIQTRWLKGDNLKLLSALPDKGVRLLLTDPPYGIDFQSNRRTASGQADKIHNDENVLRAAETFGAMLEAVCEKMADEAHLLVFTHWRAEAMFSEEIEKAGYVVRGSLIWVKDNHTSGDLECSFAPRHERIIHATRGRPLVTPRIDDVLQFGREPKTTHPTEKPTTLLRRLINSTTSEGQLVVDPFAGTGATCLAALEIQREWWGSELSENYWSEGYGRLNDAIRQLQA